MTPPPDADERPRVRPWTIWMLLAVVAVGSWDPPITQLGPLLREDERVELGREGVVAEVAGIFFREDGTVIETTVNRRRISVTPDELRRTRVMAVAGSVEKAMRPGSFTNSSSTTWFARSPTSMG